MSTIGRARTEICLERAINAIEAAKDEVQQLYDDLKAVTKERDELKAALDRWEQPESAGESK